MMSRILVVEDNLAIAEGLAYNLRHEGHDVRIAEDGEAAVADSRAWSPDLVILDLMLPKLDGYGVLAAIRETKNDVPVIILSARGEEADKVRGFRLDADQYVTKPFGVLELLERVSALLRRKVRAAEGSAPASANAIRFGDIVVDVSARDAAGSPQGSVGIRRVRALAHGRLPHRRAATEARGGSGAPAPHRHGLEGRLPVRDVITLAHPRHRTTTTSTVSRGIVMPRPT
jgi:DNA-binding response OmpR family regulator